LKHVELIPNDFRRFGTSLSKVIAHWQAFEPFRTSFPSCSSEKYKIKTPSTRCIIASKRLDKVKSPSK
jgi:hypothetical protein